jgi:hypothetical protein
MLKSKPDGWSKEFVFLPMSGVQKKIHSSSINLHFSLYIYRYYFEAIMKNYAPVGIIQVAAFQHNMTFTGDQTISAQTAVKRIIISTDPVLREIQVSRPTAFCRTSTYVSAVRPPRIMTV